MGAKHGSNDHDLARAAMEKRRKGTEPTKRELAALARVQKALDDATKEKNRRECSLADYLKMAGIDRKMLADHARRFGLPISGPEINLAALIAQMHRFLATNRGAVNGAQRPSKPTKREAEKLRRAEAAEQVSQKKWLSSHGPNLKRDSAGPREIPWDFFASLMVALIEKGFHRPESLRDVDRLVEIAYTIAARAHDVFEQSQPLVVETDDDPWLKRLREEVARNRRMNRGGREAKG